MNTPAALKKGFRHAQAITKRHAKTFYFASHALPKAYRNAADSIYALCRISDDSVDHSAGHNAQEQLHAVKENIARAFSIAPIKNPLLLAFKDTVTRYRIPQAYFDQLLEGIEMDVTKTRYATFQELYPYCYKVAGVVGLIMLKIFGAKSEEAREHAVQLGVAMQLTNILRDINEDYLRGKIYLPLDEMAQAHIQESHLANHTIDEPFIVFLASQIDRAREFYAQSEPGIALIVNPRARFTVAVMKELYAGILTAIENNQYDVFNHRAHLTKRQKITKTLALIAKGRFA